MTTPDAVEAAARADGCTAKCWTRVRCEVHGIHMPPAGRSEPDDMPTCDHQHERVNTCHLWGPHDSSRAYTDRPGWEAHVDDCPDCHEDFRGYPLTARAATLTPKEK